ncbi:MAG: energy-coupling factor transporter transmembrane component T [Pseudomonadota bacterium]
MRELFGIDDPGSERTFLHRLDVRTKMIISLLGSLSIIVFSDPGALGVLAAVSSLYVLSIRQVKIVLIVLGLVLFMWIAAIGMMAGMHAIWPKSPSLDLPKLLSPFLRTYIMMNVAMGLALSSRIQSLTAALKVLRIPFFIYIPLTVMIRFIPAFMEDVRQIAECIRTRGHRLHPIDLVMRPMLTIRLVLMPLLFRSLRSSDELGIAAELKGLGNGRRIAPLHPSRFGREDLLATVLTLMTVAAGAFIQYMARGGGGGMSL